MFDLLKEQSCPLNWGKHRQTPSSHVPWPLHSFKQDLPWRFWPTTARTVHVSSPSFRTLMNQSPEVKSWANVIKVLIKTYFFNIQSNIANDHPFDVLFSVFITQSHSLITTTCQQRFDCIIFVNLLKMFAGTRRG